MEAEGAVVVAKALKDLEGGTAEENGTAAARPKVSEEKEEEKKDGRVGGGIGSGWDGALQLLPPARQSKQSIRDIEEEPSAPSKGCDDHHQQVEKRGGGGGGDRRRKRRRRTSRSPPLATTVAATLLLPPILLDLLLALLSAAVAPTSAGGEVAAAAAAAVSGGGSPLLLLPVGLAAADEEGGPPHNQGMKKSLTVHDPLFISPSSTKMYGQRRGNFLIFPLPLSTEPLLVESRYYVAGKLNRVFLT